MAPISIAIDGADGVVFQTNTSRSERRLVVSPTAGLPLSTPAERQIQCHRDKTTLIDIGAADFPSVDRVLSSVEKRHQAKKDPKSLGQNIYDSVTAIYFCSKQLPSVKEVLQILQAPLGLKASEAIVNGDRMDLSSVMMTGQFKDSEIDSGCIANGHANSSSVQNASWLPISTSHNPPESARISRQSPAAPEVLEVLSNGDHVHKIQHRLHKVQGKHYASEYVGDHPSIDRTLDASRMRKATNNTPSVPVASNRSKSDIPPLILPIPKESLTVEQDMKQTVPPIVVASNLTSDILEAFKNDIYRHRNELSRGIDFAVDFEPDRRFRPTVPFVNRSIFFHLSSPETLLKSFREIKNSNYSNSPLPHLDAGRLAHTFRDWNHHNGSLLFDSLWHVVQALFITPPEIISQKSPLLKPTRKGSASWTSPGFSHLKSEDSVAVLERYLSDEEVAHIVMICIHALTSLVSVAWPRTWIQLRNLRSWGIIIPGSQPNKDKDGSESFIDPWLRVIDELEYEPALRLAEALLRGLGARMCFERILATLGHTENGHEDGDDTSAYSPLLDILIKHLIEVERIAIADKKRLNSRYTSSEDPGWTVTATFMEWLRTIIIKKWDGKAIVNKWSSVGVSMELFHRFKAQSTQLNLRPHMFPIPWLHERIDQNKESVKFLRWEQQPNACHIFQYPCLFQPEYLIGYFRTINFTSMCRQYQHSEQIVEMQRHLDNFTTPPFLDVINNRLKLSLSDYFVLQVGRDHLLEDTLNQLWGQEKRLLLKPLKVKMGTLDGELGHDQGGVTYEYFRVVLEEAFKPDYGMFVVDPQTNMTWFQPGSIEPDWKFEMLGVIFSLAVYNGVTLPVTFPIALYHHLLTRTHPHATQRLPEDLNFIRDGWPTLAKSFEQLLSWKDGDVADIFCRQYSFSYSAFGRNIDMDMHSLGGGKRRSVPIDEEDSNAAEHLDEEEAPLVTNDNRDQYVADYIKWLTHRSVMPQILAFCKGFHTCLHPKSLRLFNPESLRNLIEGTQVIDIAAWKATTRYEDGYSPTHKTIVDFWSIVEAYKMEDRRKLLEFVTASDRVPITGLSSINFNIVRNGPDTEILPTSSTCFGKLMLPEYGDREKLKKKLHIAIQYSKGFGVV